ncbi:MULTISPECIES: hypothetical protein [unclassified Streptomyces]|uniref:hypothetical protein n=1 Tax=unclassified Streptomyces TaxID=2593676 RepID=UPI001319D58D|nr:MULTISPECIES: hypothetical protein [unclassified Streptomyces]MYT30514.1 hypothetical protein [Streptomyces sp. SID8354]
MSSRKLKKLPEVGDEVEYAPGRMAIVTDIREGIPYLRKPGIREWRVQDPTSLTVMRTRAERIAASDFS